MESTHISQLWNVIPNKLYGMPVPTESDLEDLKDKGIKAIVCLLEDGTIVESYIKKGFENLWLPVVDDQAPTMDQAKDLVDFVEEQNKKGNPVAIHCKGGKGRTGTMIASYLITKGDSYDEAMAKINEKRPNAVKKEFQINFLKELEAN